MPFSQRWGASFNFSKKLCNFFAQFLNKTGRMGKVVCDFLPVRVFFEMHGII